MFFALFGGQEKVLEAEYAALEAAVAQMEKAVEAAGLKPSAPLKMAVGLKGRMQLKDAESANREGEI